MFSKTSGAEFIVCLFEYLGRIKNNFSKKSILAIRLPILYLGPNLSNVRPKMAKIEVFDLFVKKNSSILAEIFQKPKT